MRHEEGGERWGEERRGGGDRKGERGGGEERRGDRHLACAVSSCSCVIQHLFPLPRPTDVARGVHPRCKRQGAANAGDRAEEGEGEDRTGGPEGVRRSRVSVACQS
eukprot:767231-Hanusia_phi.AAC.2